MKIITAAERPTRRAPESYFTGTVWQDPVFEAPDPARVRAVVVSFAPGSRTNWHTHPLGQTIHILSGIGRVQKAGGPVHVVSAGDTVYFEPGERHWHGAAPDHAMVHFAVAEALNGRNVDWAEPVADGDYAAPPAP